MRTWHFEAAVIAAVLGTVVVLTGGGTAAWLGAAAVWVTARHMSVADRLREAYAAGFAYPVECADWLDRYWVGKELLWIAFFAVTGGWSALAGALLFIAYPFWRRWWRSRYPLGRG